MTTIIIGNTYTLNIEELRTIDLRGRECIASRIDNIRKFLNALIDDILVHHEQLVTSVVCYYDYQTFSISLKESYPFVKNTHMPVIFKFNCDIEHVTNKVISDVIENSIIDNGDLNNSQHAFVYRFNDSSEAPLFFQAIKIIDNALYCDNEILNKLLKNVFNPTKKNIVKTSMFNIECGGEIILHAQFDFGPFHFSIYGQQIIMSAENKNFSFSVNRSNFNHDTTFLKSVFKNFYDHFSSEFVELAYVDFITLFKMKYI